MKKVIIMLAMLTMTLVANAQFEKGKTYVGASLTGLNMNYNTGNGFCLGIGGQVGTFVKDNWLLLGQADYKHVGGDYKYDNIKIGGGARYYFQKNGIFLGANANFAYQCSGAKKADFVPAVEAGWAFFVSDKVTIEPALYYEQGCINHSVFTTVGLKVGIGLYHKKKQISDSVVDAIKELK